MSSPAASHLPIPRLGTLEAQVMDVLWDHGPATIREVINHLPAKPAYTTIATVLTNLGRKDFVTVTRADRSTSYAPRVSRQRHAAELMEFALEASRDRTASILHFVDAMPDNDLDLLRDYLSRRDTEQTA